VLSSASFGANLLGALSQRIPLSAIPDWPRAAIPSPRRVPVREPACARLASPTRTKEHSQTICGRILRIAADCREAGEIAFCHSMPVIRPFRQEMKSNAPFVPPVFFERRLKFPALSAARHPALCRNRSVYDLHRPPLAFSQNVRKRPRFRSFTSIDSGNFGRALYNGGRRISKRTRSDTVGTTKSCCLCGVLFLLSSANLPWHPYGDFNHSADPARTQHPHSGDRRPSLDRLASSERPRSVIAAHHLIFVRLIWRHTRLRRRLVAQFYELILRFLSLHYRNWRGQKLEISPPAQTLRPWRETCQTPTHSYNFDVLRRCSRPLTPVRVLHSTTSHGRGMCDKRPRPESIAEKSTRVPRGGFPSNPRGGPRSTYTHPWLNESPIPAADPIDILSCAVVQPGRPCLQCRRLRSIANQQCSFVLAPSIPRPLFSISCRRGRYDAASPNSTPIAHPFIGKAP